MPLRRRCLGIAAHVARFAGDRRGATAIEYGLIAALICLAIIGSISATGNSVSSGWASWGAKVVAALGGT